MPAIPNPDNQPQEALQHQIPDDSEQNQIDQDDLQQKEDEGPKTYHVLITGFGPFMNHKTNPSWLAAKVLHNTTISSDQWHEVFASIVSPTPSADKKKEKSSIGGSSTPPGAAASSITSPTVSNGKRSLGNGDALRSTPSSKATSGGSKASSSKGKQTASSTSIPTSPPLPPLPEPGPFNIHITALEIPVLYAAVLDIIPGLHAKPPKLPTDSAYMQLPADFPEPPELGYDFIMHVGVAGRGPLRMEIIGHKFGYNMKDADGNFCPVVPPPSSVAKSNINPTRGPGAHPPPAGVGPAGALVPSGVHYNIRGPQSGGFGSMGMGYNNERLGYNPAVHDPQPAIPGAENSVRPVRGFGTAYESFPDEMMTDIDVTRLVQDLKNSGIMQIYTSMDAGHYLCDFLYYCSLAESRRSSKVLLPYMTATQGPYYQGYTNPAYPQSQQPQQPQPGPPAAGHSTKSTNSPARTSTSNAKPARVLFMHCPPVNEPLSTEEVTEAIRRITLWVCRECEVEDIREKAQAPEEGGAGY